MADDVIVKEWLKLADEDFGFASTSLEDELEFFPQICYHFHQSGEKYLKSYIVKHDLEFKKVHDLLELLNICARNNSKLATLKEECASLNRFWLSTRYPVHYKTSFTKDDAEEAKNLPE